MKVMFKFKHFNHDWNSMTLHRDFISCNNPLPYNNLPDGEYLLRFPYKGYRREYWKLGDEWFDVDDDIDATESLHVHIVDYNLFPNLSEKEWEDIKKDLKNFRDPKWEILIRAYNHKVRKMNSSKNHRKIMYRLNKLTKEL